MKKIYFLILLLISDLSLANLSDAVSAFRSKRSASRYRSLVINLVDAGYYFSAVPWMKEYIIQTANPLDDELEERFDKMLTYTGVKPFETLGVDYLKNSKSPSVKYIIGKKLVKQRQLDEAHRWLSSVPESHNVYPFVAHLRGTISSLQGKYSEAVSHFEDCVASSKSELGRSENDILRKQLNLNADYCILGIARSYFTNKKYKEAELKYLDISKNSPIWPEILFEEAWTSYYQGNYNRSLGKLVTYNAPVFENYFNPEVDVLNSLSYLKMCLYEDSKIIANNFYSKYLNETRNFKKFILAKGKDYKFYYRLMADFEANGNASSDFMKKVLSDISRDGSFLEIRKGVVGSMKELQKLENEQVSKFTSTLKNNLRSVLNTQQNILGGYARSKMVKQYGNLVKAFQGMSYIKLDILDQKKQMLYKNENKSRERGDIKYLEKNEKQYFWNFNGEFWSDELGDYVFALGSEC
jgi:hypothetical protein